MQQDKHVIILHCEEDREVFINKLKFPKTVFHVGNNPQPGDIVVDKKFGYQRLFATWILDHYDNLPEYVILTQAIPDDHVVEPLLAMNCTFTNSWGSFAYARSMYNQWSTNWVKIMPIREIAHFLGSGFHNDNNVSKNLYYFHPGEIFYVSRKKLLEKPKSFYEKIIMLDNKEFYFEFLKSDPKPYYFWNDILKYHPELNGLPKEDKLKRLENLEWNIERDFGFSGLIFETLWFYIWADKNLFDTIDTAQACIGNELYFNTKLDKYDADFIFYPFPYHPSIQQSMMNFRLLENNWFDWDCPNYLKWREALIHQTVLEGESKGFDGLKYIKQLEQYGIKHISF
jgi:hypothetical protein